MADPQSSMNRSPSEAQKQTSTRSTSRMCKSFNEPDETRPFRGHGHLDVLNFQDGVTIGRGIFEPGWKWSNDVKPIAGTSSCEASHSGYCMEGSMVIHMNDGNEFRINAGEAFHIPPGHDAWVDGGQRCVLVDVGGFSNYAKPVTH